MSATAKDFTAEITVFLCALCPTARMTRLRHKLIDDAIEVLFDEHVIVTVEDNVDTMINQDLMNGLAPTWPMLGKFIFARRTFATPFPERSRFRAATLIAVAATDEVM
jgi:hypothetical protein